MDIRDIISLEMMRHGINTVESLANKVGMPSDTINKIMRGETKSPGLSTLNRIASGFGCTWSALEQSYKGTIDNTPTTENIIRGVLDNAAWDDATKRQLIALIREIEATGG